MHEIQEIPAGAATHLGAGVEECWMDFDGARMRYLRAGSGPPLILLHGLFGYSFSWRYTLPALAPYATVYAPDMLGAGFSDRPRGLDHSMRATAQRVLRFVKNLNIDSFDLLGTSRGGAVAMAAAAESLAEDGSQPDSQPGFATWFPTQSPAAGAGRAGESVFSAWQKAGAFFCDHVRGRDVSLRVEPPAVFVSVLAWAVVR